MKKMRRTLRMGGHSGNGLLLPLVPLFIVAIGLWVSPLSVISAFADDKSSSSQHDSPSPSGHDSDHHDGDHHDGDHHDGDHHDGDHHDGDHHDHDKCTVCHDPHNPHEIRIPCDEVQKFLDHHPGDHRGHCTVTPSTSK